MSVYLIEPENLSARPPGKGVDVDSDEGQRRRTHPERKGAYASWRSVNPRHRALMETLAGQAGTDAYSRLWLNVLDQAIVDAFEPDQSSNADWYLIEKVHTWMTTTHFDMVCELAGLEPAWVREAIEKYERRRSVTSP